MRRRLSMSLPGRRLVANLATAGAVIGAGVFLLARPIKALFDEQETQFGKVVATAADSIADVRSARHPMLAPDSVTFLVFLDAACTECRMNAALFTELASWASVQNAAVRMLLPNDAPAAAQFGRLAGADPATVFPASDWYRRLKIERTPSIVLLDHGGRVRGRWLGQTPSHLALLNVLGKFDAPAGRGRLAAVVAHNPSQSINRRSR